MLTKNDLQQIREVIKNEIDTALKPVKSKLNRIAKDLNYVAGDYDLRIVNNQRKIKKIEDYLGFPRSK